MVTNYQYDNLGRATDVLTYADTDNNYFTFDQSGRITGTYPEAAELRAKTEYFYDDLSRVYESWVYEVDQATGDDPGHVRDYLPSYTWYDKAGYVIKTQTGGTVSGTGANRTWTGSFQKYDYDALGSVCQVAHI